MGGSQTASQDLSRKELPTTTKLLLAIAPAAMIGLMIPNAASGTVIRL